MTTLLDLVGVSVSFDSPRALSPFGRPSEPIRAVRNVSLKLARGESVALVGESGSGKTTLGRAIVGLVELTEGWILFDGREMPTRRQRSLRSRIQMVFQDPNGSLNPAMNIERILLEPMIAQGGAIDNPRGRCRELIDMVGLPNSVLRLRPKQLSGGQRQRIAIARALATNPEILIADEAVSALDVSVQASILMLLRDLQKDLGLTLLFITHNLAVVRQIADRAAVMYLGRIVEEGSTEALLSTPQHPYTRALLAAVPRLGSTARTFEPLDLPEDTLTTSSGEGCAYFNRCPISIEEVCSVIQPQPQRMGSGSVACHFPQ